LDTIRKIISRQITLTYPDFSKPFDIYTDASTRQIGAVIEQSGKPLDFYSQKLNDAQTRYTVTELELLSIVEKLQEFRTILLGHPITVYTVYKNLTDDNFTTDRVRQWRLILEEYGPTIVYIKGCKNVIAGTLSRYPRNDESPPTVPHELWAIDEVNDVFPLSFDIIAAAQRADYNLQNVVQYNCDYTTKVFLRQTILHYWDKIVIPNTLQPKVIEWYHSTLMNPESNNTFTGQRYRRMSKVIVMRATFVSIKKIQSTLWNLTYEDP
jgi:RNase H-like domain found in reverse transcriptase